jgi:AraC-like DNA-binding protein
MKVNQLLNGIKVALGPFLLIQVVFFSQPAVKDEWYLLRFADLVLGGPLEFRIGNETLIDNSVNRSHVCLTVTASTGVLWFPRHNLQGIMILLNREWLAKYLEIENTRMFLKVRLKIATLDFEPMDQEYRTCIDEIIRENSQHPFHKIAAENRVMYIIERFFGRLHQKIQEKRKGKLRLKNEEVWRLMDVEALLVKESVQPPPTIPQLAKIAAMSETRLKTNFKKIYGSNIYAYYQRNRMRKAREDACSPAIFCKRSRAWKLVIQTLAILRWPSRKNSIFYPANCWLRLLRSDFLTGLRQALP